MEKPIYKHDCDKCIFMGTYRDEDINIDLDLYVHLADCIGETELVARMSDDGPDYLSVTINNLFRFPHIISSKIHRETLKRAIERHIQIP